MRWVRFASAALLVGAIAACESLEDVGDLDVINENAPDTERALGTPSDIESLMGGTYSVYGNAGPHWRAILNHTTGADEVTMSWGNFGMRDFSSEPRVAFNNASSYAYAYVAEEPWYEQYQVLSSIFDVLNAVEDDPAVAAALNTDRVRAFSRFMQGLAHGYLALVFDSAFIFDETADLDNDVLLLQPYPAVMAAAIGYLNEAVTLAAGGSWSLEGTWINGNPLTAAELAQLAHSYAARNLAGVGRTPADRQAMAGAAPDWNTVIGHVDAGITSDLVIDGDGWGVWDHAYRFTNNIGRTWGRADYKTIGYTEVGLGLGYDNWLQTPVAQRVEFDLDIPDRRITPGPPPHTEFVTEGLYFLHQGHPDHREARGTYHWSAYGHIRHNDLVDAAGVGPIPVITVDEMQLYKAEGLIRTGAAGAAAIINNTRVTNGQLTPATDGDADIMDKVWYEMAIENFIMCDCAYFNRRGFGPLSPTGPNHHLGLVEGTPLHFPIPGKEIEVLLKKPYTHGGVGNEGGALAPPAAAAQGELTGTRVPARFVYSFSGENAPRTALEKLAFIQSRAISRGASDLTRYH